MIRGVIFTGVIVFAQFWLTYLAVICYLFEFILESCERYDPYSQIIRQLKLWQ